MAILFLSSESFFIKFIAFIRSSASLGFTNKPHSASSTIVLVHPAELTIIGLAAERESNNLFGELVYKIGILENKTIERSQKLIISDISDIGTRENILILSNLNSVIAFATLLYLLPCPTTTNSISLTCCSFNFFAASIITSKSLDCPIWPKYIALKESFLSPIFSINSMFFSRGQNLSILAILGIIDVLSFSIYFNTPSNIPGDRATVCIDFLYMIFSHQLRNFITNLFFIAPI